jgi:uncharacterized protein (DUF2062 family)
MEPTLPKRPPRNLLIRLRPLLRWIVRLRSSPRAIAGGFAVGTFIAFTPTVGIQLILAVFLATILNLNRAASLVPVWITNPVTVAPIYTINYWLGLKLMDGPPLAEVSGLFIEIGTSMAKMEFWDFKDQFFAVLQMGNDILLPLFTGGIIIGLVSGALAYLVSLKLLSIFFTRRARKRLLNKRQGK